MKQKIGGYSIDLLTSDEVRGHLTWLHDRWMAAQYRGISYLMFTATADPAAAAGPLVFSGPDSGYAWAIKLIGVQASAGDAATAAVSVYLGEGTATAPVRTGQLAPGASGNLEHVMNWTGNTLVLTDQRVLTVAATPGVTLMTARLHVKQVPAEMTAKL